MIPASPRIRRVWRTVTSSLRRCVFVCQRAGAEEWFTALSSAGVPAGPIHDIAGAFGLAERLGP